MQVFKAEDSCGAGRLAGKIRRSWVSRTTMRSLSVLLVAALLVACGSSSSNNATTPVADSEVVSSAAIEAFAAIGVEVRQTTPEVADAANPTLDDWADWKGGSEYAVFDKLFTTSSAESIYTPVDFLEELVLVIETADSANSSAWDEAGIIDVSGINPETGDTVTIPVTVALVTDDIALPTFFQDKVNSGIQHDMTASMNRIISFTFVDGNGGGWDTEVAIGEDDAYYYLIMSAVHEGINETQTFVAYMERVSATMTLYYASADDGASGVYTKWSGNTGQNWFSIAQVTDAGGNQEVVGGGSVSDVMAFKARNHADSAESTDVYYLIDLTASNIEGNIVPDPDVLPVAGVPTEGTGSIEYIIEGNINCLGWPGVGSFPADRAALEWTPISE